MTLFKAVAHPRFYYPSKRDALWFDEVAIISLEHNLKLLSAEQAAELVWLAEHGIVSDAYLNLATEPASAVRLRTATSLLLGYGAAVEVLSGVQANETSPEQAINPSTLRAMIKSSRFAPVIDAEMSVETARSFLQSVFKHDPDEAAIRSAIALAYEIGQNYSVRGFAQELSLRDNCEAVPLIRTSPALVTPDALGKSDVVEVVLRALPTPDLNTPWEAILDFRINEDVRRTQRRLRHWCQKICAEVRTRQEVEGELQDLLDQYNEYMKIQRLKTTRTTLQIVITSVAAALENIARFRLGEAAKQLFAIQDQRISLMEAELAAPGREVAYIAEAERRFGMPSA